MPKSIRIIHKLRDENAKLQAELLKLR
jgi:hypothetical protein